VILKIILIELCANDYPLCFQALSQLRYTLTVRQFLLRRRG